MKNTSFNTSWTSGAIKGSIKMFVKTGLVVIIFCILIISIRDMKGGSPAPGLYTRGLPLILVLMIWGGLVGFFSHSLGKQHGKLSRILMVVSSYILSVVLLSFYLILATAYKTISDEILTAMFYGLLGIVLPILNSSILNL